MRQEARKIQCQVDFPYTPSFGGCCSERRMARTFELGIFNLTGAVHALAIPWLTGPPNSLRRRASRGSGFRHCQQRGVIALWFCANEGGASCFGARGVDGSPYRAVGVQPWTNRAGCRRPWSRIEPYMHLFDPAAPAEQTINLDLSIGSPVGQESQVWVAMLS